MLGDSERDVRVPVVLGRFPVSMNDQISQPARFFKCCYESVVRLNPFAHDPMKVVAEPFEQIDLVAIRHPVEHEQARGVRTVRNVPAQQAVEIPFEAVEST